MPAFRFEAIDQAGKSQKGVLDADSARAARSQLRTQGLTPLVVEAAEAARAVSASSGYRWENACRNASRPF
jgi:type II secretory pathway component PulF